MDWMENRVISLICFAFFLLTAGGVATIILMPEGYLTSNEVETESVRSFVIKTKGEHDLAIRIPPEVDTSKIICETGEDGKSYTITVPGFNENDFYEFPMEGECEGISSLEYAQKGHSGIFEIKTDHYVYLKSSIGEDGYLYLDLCDLHEEYDHIILIDAGHGGSDSGATIDDAVEKDINLSIVKKMQKLFAEDKNIKVFYTRLDDGGVEEEKRAALCVDAGADLMLSVHMNSTASGRMSAIEGASVLYRVSDKSGGSMAFARNCLDSLVKKTGCGSKGLIAGDDTYIIGHCRVPVALVECGFLTNASEQKKLLTDEYQDKCAEALYEAVKQTLTESKEAKK